MHVAIRKIVLLSAMVVLATLIVSVVPVQSGVLSRSQTWRGIGKAPALATENTEESSKGSHGSEGAAEGGTKAEQEEEEHAGPPPFMYFVQWLVLIAAFGLGLGYLLRVRTKGKARHEGLRLAYALTFLVFLFFVLSYYPSITKYHEPGVIGMLKFLLLLATGALTTFYGVLGRHQEH